MQLRVLEPLFRIGLLGSLSLLLAAPSALAKDKPITAKDEIAFGIRMAERELWSEALFRFQQAEIMGANGAAVYNNMAVAYEALGVFDKAREYYQKALSVDRDSQSLRRNYSRFVEFYQAFNTDDDAADGTGDEDDEGDEEGEAEEAVSEDPEEAAGREDPSLASDS
jgi:tetratricopeptide (TPR) repeat protein